MNEFLSAQTKFLRACTLLSQLESEMNAWVSGPKPIFNVGVSEDRRLFRAEYRLQVTPDYSSWAVLTGDILFNLRCVLDHIVFELANERVRKDPIAAKKLMFPVCATLRDFTSQLKSGRLKGVTAATIEAIQSIQPFVTSANNIRESKLFVLHELNNIDKHRRLHTALFSLVDNSTMQWTLNASQPTIINWFANSGPLKNEDWLLEATTSAPLAENPTINTHLKFCFRLTEPGYDKLELASLLRGLTGGVLAIADRVTKGAFDRALESSRS